MHIGADVLLLTDVHLELEDGDHDVIPDVISPLSFRVVMNKLMRFQLLMLVYVTIMSLMYM